MLIGEEVEKIKEGRKENNNILRIYLYIDTVFHP
jgi:hypothetical protein